MPKDTITLALNGEVSFRHFAEAISHFQSLVEALSKEVGEDGDIDWVVHDLQVGSATATVRGEAEAPEQVERVVSAYGRLGRQLECGERPDFSRQVIKEVEGITRVLNGRITSIRFETADTDATVSSQPSIAIGTSTKTSRGAIEGRIQTLSNRKGLRFNLYDTIHDRSVSCYLQEGQEDLIREVWGKRAIVEGELSRETVSGRAVAIRRISGIRPLPEVVRGSYLRARGIAPRRSEAPLAEEVIRRLRDG